MTDQCCPDIAAPGVARSIDSGTINGLNGTVSDGTSVPPVTDTNSQQTLEPNLLEQIPPANRPGIRGYLQHIYGCVPENIGEFPNLTLTEDSSGRPIVPCNGAVPIDLETAFNRAYNALQGPNVPQPSDTTSETTFNTEPPPVTRPDTNGDTNTDSARNTSTIPGTAPDTAPLTNELEQNGVDDTTTGGDGSSLYEIQWGDSLWKISDNILQTRFGRQADVKEIWQEIDRLATANNISNPHLIYAGSTLIIPAIKGFEQIEDEPDQPDFSPDMV